MVTNGRYLREMVTDLSERAQKLGSDVLRLGIQLGQEIEQNKALGRMLAAEQTNAEWLRVRVNALEQDKAMLLDRIINAPARVAIPVPEIQSFTAPATGTGADPTGTSIHTLSGDPRQLWGDAAFEDVGDERAALLGLDSYENGTTGATGVTP